MVDFTLFLYDEILGQTVEELGGSKTVEIADHAVVIDDLEGVRGAGTPLP